MAINQILPFGLAASANVLTPEEYTALAARVGGFGAGVARSREVNTPLRQSSFIAAMIGQFIADRAQVDVLDDGDIPALMAKFSEALGGMVAEEMSKSLVGSVSYFGRGQAPEGWLVADGTAVPVATYPALAEYIYVGDAANGAAPWGYRCTNPENPATTRAVNGNFIVLPDLRGEFIRGWAGGRQVDAARAFGSWQKGSVHSFDSGSNIATLGDRTNSPGTGAGQDDLGLDFVSSTVDYPRGRFAQSTGADGVLSNGPEIGWGVMRPRNVALLACIKY